MGELCELYARLEVLERISRDRRLGGEITLLQPDAVEHARSRRAQRQRLPCDPFEAVIPDPVTAMTGGNGARGLEPRRGSTRTSLTAKDAGWRSLADRL